MAFVTSKNLLLAAQKNGYAVPACNVENMEMAQGIIAAANRMESPVIIQTTPGTLAYADITLYFSIVKALAEQASVPIALHLDHGSSFALAMKALRAGYSSIMIDGSPLSLSENIQLSRRVVEVATLMNVPVEAELGKVGGKEDGLDGGSGQYTDPEEAKAFVEQTGVDSLAVAIGTAHGIYKGEPKLDIQRLAAIQKRVSVPLVLHGASGIAEKSIQECIAAGVAKVNFATELRVAYSRGVTEVLQEAPNTIDPKAYSKKGRDYVTETVTHCIAMCGSAGRAYNQTT